jgi:hypothetical protein
MVADEGATTGEGMATTGGTFVELRSADTPLLPFAVCRLPFFFTSDTPASCMISK